MKRLLTSAALVAVAALVGGCSSGATPAGSDTSAGAAASGAASHRTDATGTPSVPPAASSDAATTGSSPSPQASASPHKKRSTAPVSQTEAKGPKSQSKVLTSLPGSSSSKCANVGGQRNVRAGDVAAGNFAAARKQFRQQPKGGHGPDVDLYVIPAHAAQMSHVTVTLRHLDGKAGTHSVTSDAVERAEQWRYYPVRLAIPETGNWRLSVVAGKDRGCFEVNFGG